MMSKNCFIPLMFTHHCGIKNPLYLDLCVTILHVNTQIYKYILQLLFQKLMYKLDLVELIQESYLIKWELKFEYLSP
jgi:hypothetical protein